MKITTKRVFWNDERFPVKDGWAVYLQTENCSVRLGYIEYSQRDKCKYTAVIEYPSDNKRGQNRYATPCSTYDEALAFISTNGLEG